MRTLKRKQTAIIQEYEKLFTEIDIEISKLTLEETINIPDAVKDLIELNNREYNHIAENFNKKNYPKMKFNTVRNSAYDEIRRIGINVYFDEVCEILWNEYNIQLFQASREFDFITKMYPQESTNNAAVKAYSKIVNKK